MYNNSMPQPFDPFVPINEEHKIASRIRRARQISESHCGPAVIEMLLSHLDIQVTQQQLSDAINAHEFIEDRGTRPEELAAAVAIVAPQAQFWYKEHTTVEELEMLVHQFHFPVGVEWQNLFYESIEEELEDTEGTPHLYDFGHYSIVRYIDVENDEIIMMDPYMEFSERDRYFSLQWFLTRWWDYNQIKDPVGGRIYSKKDDRLSFILTLKGTPFPKVIGMRPL